MDSLTFAAGELMDKSASPSDILILQGRLENLCRDLGRAIEIDDLAAISAAPDKVR